MLDHQRGLKVDASVAGTARVAAAAVAAAVAAAGLAYLDSVVGVTGHHVGSWRAREVGRVGEVGPRVGCGAEVEVLRSADHLYFLDASVPRCVHDVIGNPPFLGLGDEVPPEDHPSSCGVAYPEGVPYDHACVGGACLPCGGEGVAYDVPPSSAGRLFLHDAGVVPSVDRP